MTTSLGHAPFGMQLQGRNFQAGDYRYGFNGQEKSNEIRSDENSYSAEYWQYDPRSGRRWNIDPKPIVSNSVYSCFAGNPLFYSDVKGDSIRTYFLNNKNDLYGGYQSEIPDKVQKMFNEEYGIKVGYNSETHMLYYAGDFETEKPVSKTAKDKLVSMLSAGYSPRKSERKFGRLFFGKEGMKSHTGEEVGSGSASRPLRLFGLGSKGDAYMNLDAFSDDFSLKEYDYSGLINRGYSSRTFNMARVFEHEYFGHIIIGRFDPSEGHLKSGKVESLPNLFRSEMGLPLRSNYGIFTKRGVVILFGASSDEVRAAAYDHKTIPNNPYVLKSILKN